MTPPSELRGAVLGRGYRLGHAVEGEESVFEATHERVPGRVVVRVFPNESLSRPDAGARIHQAVRLASLLRATHAIQLLDFNLAGDTPAFVVTERVEGRTLAKVMADDGMLSLPATIDIVEAIASAVHAAHRLGLTHGDLRAPLIVVPDGGGARAKVGGFGWAKELRAAAIQPPRPGLLAPEQHGGRVVTIDPRADQYGLAGLAYELLAACPPFPEEPPGGEQTARVPSPLGELVPGIPHAVDEVLHRALSQRPRDRFEDIAEFAARLRQAAAHAPITVPLAALPALAVPNTRQNGERNGARRSVPPPMPAALPAFPVATDEITEEMDNQTLFPLVAKADSGGTISSRIQREDSLDIDLLGHVARETGYASDGELNIDVSTSDTAHALTGSRPYPIDAAAIAEMLDSKATPPPEVATLVQQSPFILPAVQMRAEAETPPPLTPPLQPAVPGALPRRPSARYSTLAGLPGEVPRRPSQPHAAVPDPLPRRSSQPHSAVPTELPRRSSQPYAAVPAEVPRRSSQPHAAVPAEVPRRSSQPHAAVPTELPRRQSAPYSTLGGVPGELPRRPSQPHAAVPGELPRRPSAPYSTLGGVPGELPRRPSQPHAAVPGELPRRPSAPYAVVPVELPRRPSQPHAAVPGELPRRPSQPHPTLRGAEEMPAPSSWPAVAAPGPTPYQPVVAPQDRYVLQPVEINLGLPPPPPPMPPSARLRTLGYGEARGLQAQRPLYGYGAPARPFVADAGAFAPTVAPSGKWKVAFAAAALVLALGAVYVMQGKGRGKSALATDQATPAAVAAVSPTPAENPIFAGAPAAIIAPVDPDTVDPASNGQGDCAVRITSTPAAVVMIDGKDTGHSTPLLGFRVTCGLHRLLLRHPDSGMQRGDILKVIPGRPYTANYTFGPSTLAPAPETAVDSVPPRLAMKRGTARRHTHRRHHRQRPALQYVDEFE